MKGPRNIHTLLTILLTTALLSAAVAPAPAQPNITIGLDGRHGFSASSILATGAEYDTLRATVGGAGRTVVVMDRFDSLSGLDVLFVKQPYTQNANAGFSAGEIAAMVSFAANGGSLVIVADGGDGSSAMVANLNELAGNFGVAFAAAASDYEDHTIGSLLPHPLTAGVGSIVIRSQRRIETFTDPTLDLTSGSGADDALAVLDGVDGAGSVVLLSDSSVWRDPDTGVSGISAGGNLLLLQNVIDFASLKLTVSGWISPPGAAVTFNSLNGTMLVSLTSGADGFYTYNRVPYNWSGTITPTLANHTFTPPSRSYTRLTIGQNDQNFTGLTNLWVSGWTAPNTQLTFLNADSSLLTVVAADDGGFYQYTAIPSGWSGTVTPFREGTAFGPAQRTYTNLTLGLFNQNFAALSNMTVSGFAVPGTVLTLANADSSILASVTADASGFYVYTSFPPGWSGTITPVLATYSFTPELRTYDNLATDLGSQNFTGVRDLAISGTTLPGTLLAFRNADGTPLATVTADPAGQYIYQEVPNNWSGSITAMREGCTFSPPSRAYGNLVVDLTGQDFTGNCPQSLTISGWTVPGTLIVFTNADGTPFATIMADPAGGANPGLYLYRGVPYGWSGTVTPENYGYAFSPPHRTYSSTIADQYDQNFNAIDALTVPGNYLTIQEALDAAFDGDQIVVSPGVYRENVDFGGKNVVLRSTDPDNPHIVASTIIDARTTGSVVTFSGLEDATCELYGFTLRNGLADFGGGIHGNGARATIRRCIIRGNSAVDGGGIWNFAGAIEQCEVSENSAIRGGGLYLCNGPIRDNQKPTSEFAEFGGIKNNSATDFGGGLFECGGAIERNEISGNAAASGAGLFRCNGLIQDHLYNAVTQSGGISGNIATATGGGLLECNGTIRRNDVSENESDFGAGLADCDGQVSNCAVVGNLARRKGGGLAWCDGELYNLTLTGNEARVEGGGIYASLGAIANCIVWRNVAPVGPQLHQSSTPNYSDVEGIGPVGFRNISADPQFIDPFSSIFERTSMIGYWPLDAAPFDVSANWLNGQAFGTRAIAGQYGGAYQFNGIDDSIDAGERNGTVDQLAGLTFGGWVKTDESAIMSVMSVNSRDNDNYLVGTFLREFFDPPVYIPPHFDLVVNDEIIRLAPEGRVFVGDNNWHHVMWVIAQDAITFYLDGVLVADNLGAADDATDDQAVPANVLDLGAISVRLASFAPRSLLNLQLTNFKGGLDDVVLLNRNVSANEVRSLFDDVNDNNVAYFFEVNRGDDYNVRLKAESLCVDAGQAIAGVTLDMDRNPRGYDGTPDARGDGSDYDIGAAEFSGNNPPQTPVTLEPENGAVAVPLVPVLVAAPFSDPDSGNLHAGSKWQVSAVSDFSTLLVNEPSLPPSSLISFSVPADALTTGTVYYWRVQYMDNTGIWSDWSAAASFTTIFPPNQPTNISPANAATDVGLLPPPVLRASAFDGRSVGNTHKASQWQVATDVNFRTPVLEELTGPTSQFQLPGGLLQSNTGYFWRVRYRNNRDLWSAWSVATTFVTKAPVQYRIEGLTRGAPGAVLTFITNYGEPDEEPLGAVTSDLITNRYTMFVPEGWTGRAIATMPGFTFRPAFRDFTSVTDNQILDFDGFVDVSISGNTLPATLIVFTNADGTIRAEVLSEPDGLYENEHVPANWTGTVAPYRAGYTFIHPQTGDYHQIPYNDLQEDRENQNFLNYRQIVVNVPADFPTIQGAVDQQVVDGFHGATIVAAPGIYRENVNLRGMSLTLRSTQPLNRHVVDHTIIDGGLDPAQTDLDGFIDGTVPAIVQGEAFGAAVSYTGVENRTSFLQGFTIQHGATLESGGGVSADGADVHIQYNIITANIAEQNGGGIWGVGQYGSVTDNYIIWRNIAGQSGGGLSQVAGPIERNPINENEAVDFGGGLANCSGVIANNSIWKNLAANGGGLFACEATIRENLIGDNAAFLAGGGLFGCSSAFIEANDIVTNFAGFGGGLWECDGFIWNNNITGNLARLKGGAFAWCDGLIANNTISGNTAWYEGGAFYQCNDATVTNCIIWNNKGGFRSPQFANDPGANEPTNSFIENYTGGGAGNISAALDQDGNEAFPAPGDSTYANSPVLDDFVIMYDRERNRNFDGTRQDIVAHFSFESYDEAAGVFVNSSRNWGHGSLSNGAAVDFAGRLGMAAGFNGADQWVELGRGPNPFVQWLDATTTHTDGLSLGCWIRITTRQEMAILSLVGAGADTLTLGFTPERPVVGGTIPAQMIIIQGDPVNRPYHLVTPKSGVFAVTLPYNIGDGQWHHLAFSVVPRYMTAKPDIIDDYTISCYINRLIVANFPTQFTGISSDTLLVDTADVTMCLARTADPVGAMSLFQGEMDDVVVLSRSLSAIDAANLGQESRRTGLSAFWRVNWYDRYVMHLTATSVCIDAGADVLNVEPRTGSMLNVDIEDDPRALGSFDIGADEYGPMNVASPFVQQQYKDFLEREGDAAGVRYYAQGLFFGSMLPEQVVAAFLNSPEFSGNNGFIARCYFGIFNDNGAFDYNDPDYRIPDYGGMVYYAEAIRQALADGTSLIDAKLTIVRGFLNSPEWQARVGSLDDGEYVEFLYTHILGRAAEAGGRAFHLNDLAAGRTTREILVLQFLESPEAVERYRNHTLVVMAYQGLLDRAADRGGFNFHMDNLEGGVVEVAQFLAGFVYSSEYLQRLIREGVSFPFDAP